MANTTRFRGWRFDADNDRLDIFYNGTRVGHVDGSGMSLTGALTATGGITASGAATVEGDFIAGDSTTGSLIETDASADKIGFFGATPVTVPELATSDAAGIIAALVSLGLVTDSA